MLFADNSTVRHRARCELKRRYFHGGYLWPWILVIIVPFVLRFVMFYDVTFPFQSSPSSTPVGVRPKELQSYQRLRENLDSSLPCPRDGDLELPVIHNNRPVIRPDEDAWITHDDWTNRHSKDPMIKTDIQRSKGHDQSVTIRPYGQDLEDAEDFVLTEENEEDIIVEVGGAESQFREIGKRIKAVKNFHGQKDNAEEMKELSRLKNGEDERLAEEQERADDDQRQTGVFGQNIDEKKTSEEDEAEAETKPAEDYEDRVAEERRATAEGMEVDEERMVAEENEANKKTSAEEMEAEERRVAEELEAAEEKKVAEVMEADKERRAAEEKKVAEVMEADKERRAAEELEAAEEKKVAEVMEADKERRAAEEKETTEQTKAAEEVRKADEQGKTGGEEGEAEKTDAHETEADESTNDEGQKQASQQLEVEKKNFNEEEQKTANDQNEDAGAVKLEESTDESKHSEDQSQVEKEKGEEKIEDSDGENITSLNDQTEGESLAGRCDLFEGDWEWDPEGSLYTNSTCFYMQSAQNCMSNGRPDTDYLHWKWKPRDCDLPRFDAKAFLEAFKGKTIGFVGDSLARNQMQSLLCMLSQIEVPRLVYQSRDDATVLWLYEQHEVTLSVVWSPYLLKESNEGIMGFEKGQSVLYLDVLDAAWISAMQDFDIIVLSIGQWYFKGSIYVNQDEVVGCHYCPGYNFTEIRYQEAYQGAVRQVLEKVASEFRGIAIMSTFAISHFEDGSWENGGQCRREKPLNKEESGKFPGVHNEMHDIVMNEFNSISNDKSKLNEDVKLEFLDVTKVSLARADGHPGPYRRVNPYQGRSPDEWVPNDCLHWCLPGPVDTWNQLLVKIVHRYL